MPVYAAAHGEVVGAPSQMSTEAGTTTVLVLREDQPHGSSAEYEVRCAHPQLGRRVLERVRLGDHVVVLGTLQLHPVLGPIEDPASAARVTLDAASVSLDLRDAEDTDAVP